MLTTSGRQRTSLLFAIALTSAILALTAYELVIQWQLVAQKGQVGDDFAFYRSVGDRWLSTGSFYRPEQLTGPYAMELNVAHAEMDVAHGDTGRVRLGELRHGLQ